MTTKEGKLLTDKVIMVMFTYLFYTTGQLVGLILDANPQAALAKDRIILVTTLFILQLRTLDLKQLKL